MGKMHDDIIDLKYKEAMKILIIKSFEELAKNLVIRTRISFNISLNFEDENQTIKVIH